jgi:heparin binding hemagglutinin HbhA
MPAMPKTEDVRQAREQAETAVHTTFEAVKSPLLAALGAVDTATHVVTEAFCKARSGAGERAEETQHRLQKALNELQARASELPKEISELRHRLEPAELRKLAEEYREAAQKAYASLVERGEEVYGELRSKPVVKQAIDSVESGVDTAQERLEIVVRDLNATVEELRSRFARTSRSVGEKAAIQTQRAATAAGEQVKETADKLAGAASGAGEQVKDTAEKVAEATTEAGDDAAATTRSASRKVANRATPPAPQHKEPSRRPGDNSTRRS